MQFFVKLHAGEHALSMLPMHAILGFSNSLQIEVMGAFTKEPSQSCMIDRNTNI